jgi:hypothetical protein
MGMGICRAFMFLCKDGKQQVPEIFHEEIGDVLLHNVDSRMQGIVHVCEFDKITRTLGLFGGLQVLAEVRRTFWVHRDGHPVTLP